MGRIEDLIKRYTDHISLPWQQNLAGDQKTIFVIYPKEEERRLRARIDVFGLETTRISLGLKWKTFDCTKVFAEWMATMEYAQTYFEEPENIEPKLRSAFPKHVAALLRRTLTAEDVDGRTVVAVYGVASLYGLTKMSLVLREVVNDIRGRLVLFFPGEFDSNNYRLLDARDGFNYLAVPITLGDGAHGV